MKYTKAEARNRPNNNGGKGPNKKPFDRNQRRDFR
jgi:hypothetical protein